MNQSDTTRASSIVIWTIVLLFAWAASGCGAAGQDGADPADGLAVETTVVPTTEGEGLDGEVVTEVESSDTTRAGDAAASEDPDGGSGPDAEDILTMLVEGDGEAPTMPAEGSDLTLGGSPNTAAADSIASGLEAAGVALDGVTVSVLPVSGMAVSLLILEVSDECLETAVPGQDESDDMTAAVLDLPEIEDASIVEVVTIYRGEDEVGPFTMTFTVSVEDLRQSFESGTELGDGLQVQLERES